MLARSFLQMNLSLLYGKISGTFDFTNSPFFQFFTTVSLACEAHKSDRMYHLQFATLNSENAKKCQNIYGYVTPPTGKICYFRPLLHNVLFFPNAE